MQGTMDMRKYLGAAAMLAATTSLASAGNLDRSFQNIAPIFEEGDYAELSFGVVKPSLSGVDGAAFGSGATGNVANSFLNFGLAYKKQFNDKFSFALIFDQPFGADIAYPAGSSVALGGTTANLDVNTLSGIGRYEFGNRFSVHGGIKLQEMSGAVDLAGAAYGGLSGYSVTFDKDYAAGYLLGAAYEIPDIALRVALTYHSEISHDLDTRENIAPAAVTGTNIVTPDSINLDFQSGIAEDTLLFGQIRYVDYSEVSVIPTAFGGVTPAGTSLVDIVDATFLTLGVGRRFSDKFSGAVSVRYEMSDTPLVSPLGPTDGSIGLTVGGTYTMNNMKITGGINYTKLGDSTPRTGGIARANFTDNDAIGVGIRIGYSY